MNAESKPTEPHSVTSPHHQNIHPHVSFLGYSHDGYIHSGKTSLFQQQHRRWFLTALAWKSSRHGTPGTDVRSGDERRTEGKDNASGKMGGTNSDGETMMNYNISQDKRRIL